MTVAGGGGTGVCVRTPVVFAVKVAVASGIAAVINDICCCGVAVGTHDIVKCKRRLIANAKRFFIFCSWRDGTSELERN
jgi:hypothetical protein